MHASLWLQSFRGGCCRQDKNGKYDEVRHTLLVCRDNRFDGNHICASTIVGIVEIKNDKNGLLLAIETEAALISSAASFLMKTVYKNRSNRSFGTPQIGHFPGGWFRAQR